MAQEEEPEVVQPKGRLSWIPRPSPLHRKVFLISIGSFALAGLVVLSCGQVKSFFDNGLSDEDRAFLDRRIDTLVEGFNATSSDGFENAHLADVPELPSQVVAKQCIVIASLLTHPILIYADNHDCSYEKRSSMSHPVICNGKALRCFPIPPNDLIP